ncbi:plexin-2-like isoform X1 [Ptychodera flava]|uniref:plexin-2-like isoform X1 n=1 Tax=Ptychodera flava TaxID=63121 RepID=UPI00396A172E
MQHEKVTLYNCSTNRRDCSECLSNITTRLPLNCGWCGKSKKCELEELCDSDWWDFGTMNNCDPPSITQVWPMSGPFEGNTEIVVQGTNLERHASDIVSVTLANASCNHIPGRYIVSKKLECKTSALVADGTGNVVVTIIANNGDEQKAYFNENFTFRNPRVLNFTPKLGPKSGGTVVALHGEYLNAGRIIEAYFSGSPCQLHRMDDRNNETVVFCNTTSTNITDSAELSMYFDGSKRLAPIDKKFNFTEDPSVKNINPLSSMKSGGRKIEVTGTYFRSIRQPRMLITAGRPFVSEQPCDVRSFGEMDCISPTVDISVLLRNNQNKDDNEVTVGFIMDAVEEVRKLEFDFNIVDDPEYYPFMGEENIKEHHGGQLFVRGKNLNLAATESEVTVIIGQEECKVISLSNVQLNCIPPDTQPKGVNKSGNPTENGLPTVIVGIGNLEFFIGYLKYPVTGQASLSVPVGNIVAVFALLVVVTTAIVAVYYLRNRKLDRQIAEAEERLQTIVMAIRAGPDISVPFSDYRKYTANMIYDLHTAKQELRRSLQNNNDRTMDLAKFYSLLTNKSFCLVFIRTLEQQSKITKDEKKAIGSLLTITVQNEKNMLYLPEILEELLTDAVIKADRTKKGTLKLKRHILENHCTTYFLS